MRTRLVGVFLALTGMLVGPGAVAAPAQAGPTDGFVTRHGADLKLDGKKFRFGGTNNYYLMYKSRLMVMTSSSTPGRPASPFSVPGGSSTSLGRTAATRSATIRRAPTGPSTVVRATPAQLDFRQSSGVLSSNGVALAVAYVRGGTVTQDCPLTGAIVRRRVRCLCRAGVRALRF
jgi:hypothetical protein